MCVGVMPVRESPRINLISFRFERVRKSRSRVGFNVTFGTLITKFLPCLDFLLPSSLSWCKRTNSVLQFPSFILVPSFLCSSIFVPFLLYSAALKTQQTLPFNRLFNEAAIKLVPALIPSRLPAAFIVIGTLRVITSYRKAASCAN